MYSIHVYSIYIYIYDTSRYVYKFVFFMYAQYIHVCLICPKGNFNTDLLLCTVRPHP